MLAPSSSSLLAQAETLTVDWPGHNRAFSCPEAAERQTSDAVVGHTRSTQPSLSLIEPVMHRLSYDCTGPTQPLSLLILVLRKNRPTYLPVAFIIFVPSLDADWEYARSYQIVGAGWHWPCCCTAQSGHHALSLAAPAHTAMQITAAPPFGSLELCCPSPNSQPSHLETSTGSRHHFLPRRPSSHLVSLAIHPDSNFFVRLLFLSSLPIRPSAELTREAKGH